MDAILPDAALVPLEPQPAGLAWPAADWETGPLPSGVDLDPLLDEAFDPDGELRETQAVVVICGGRLVAERYGGSLPSFDQPPAPVERDTRLLSWSMAKSMLHAVVGMLVGEGRLELDAPAPVPAWADDDRRAITLEHLLTMRDGLDFVEDYVDDRVSDVIDMLFASGQHDVAAYARSKPAAAPPGARFSYSSGTSNVLSGIVAGVVGPGDAYRRFLEERLFGAIGMPADAGFDDAGTWVASTFVHATARDFARFGYLYLRDGVWDGRRLLPEGWVDHGRRPRSVDPEDGELYGAHWWARAGDPATFYAAGYEGQSITISPELDLVVVRLGKTPKERAEPLRAWRWRVLDAFRAAG